MKPIYKKVLVWILLILHIMLIFSFSLQTAEESTVISSTLTDKVKTQEMFEEKIRVQADGGEKLSEKRIEMLAKKEFLKLEGLLRMVAHMTLFFILGLLINFLMTAYGMKKIFCVAISPVFAMSVGFFDETIQLFTVGRAGSLSDVFTDFAGAIIASAFFFAGGKLYEKIKEKRIEMDSYKF